MALDKAARPVSPRGDGEDGTPTLALSVPDRVHQEILRAVQDGRYAAGERLTEPRLVAEHAASRVPLREALKRLAVEGVLDVYPNRGAVVHVLRRQDVAEFFQMRMALEGLAAKLTAQRINEDDNRHYFAGLLESNRDGRSDDTPEAFAMHDDLMHGGLVRRSHNELLLKHWNQLQLPVHRLRHLAHSSSWDLSTSTHEHESVLDAVMAGDGDTAQRHMADHLQHVLNRVTQLPQSQFDAVFNPGLKAS